MDEFAGALPLTLVTQEDALEQRFEAELSRWSSLAFRVAYSVVRQREDAEDIAQDVLTRAHRCLPQLRDPDRLQAWLVRMTWRLAMNHRKADERRRRREDSAGRQQSPVADNHAIAAERVRRVWAAIDALPERLRLVVLLASIQEHDLAQVASALAIPEGTVKSRLFKARALLRERLR
jgi:RNA polymerase sigma-70 factor (ECF subfamily)